MDPLPIRDRGYAHPELLAETDWLADHLTDPKVRLIDARLPENYASNHVPGAVNLSSGGIPRTANRDMPGPEKFANEAGNLGISNDTTVVVYDASGPMAGMVAWAFLYYGHMDVRILTVAWRSGPVRTGRCRPRYQNILPPILFPNSRRRSIAPWIRQRLVQASRRPYSGTLAAWRNSKGLLWPDLERRYGWAGFQARSTSNGGSCSTRSRIR